MPEKNLPSVPDDLAFVGLGDEVTMEGEYYTGAGGDDAMRITIRKGERSWTVDFTYEDAVDGKRYLKTIEADEEVKVEVDMTGHVNLSLNVDPDWEPPDE